MLSIIPTPIGNLKDITLRALEVLKEADVIVCEDTRHSQKLLKHYEIDKKLVSYHEHSNESRTKQILDWLKEDKKIALISDAGMPLISDPGFRLVQEVVLKKYPIEVLPGAQAAVTGLVLSGLATDAFSFLGFLAPKTVRRKKEIEGYKIYTTTLIFYESPHRLASMLADLYDVLGDREAVVTRELTKKFEEAKRGTLSELAAFYKDKKVQGEIVVVVAGYERKKLFAKVGV